MNNLDFNAMSWEQQVEYFKGVGVRTTYNIAMDDTHPLYISANDYFDEKNE
jgi:hypothetical protein